MKIDVIPITSLQIHVPHSTLNLVVLMCSLWGGSVLNLGTKKHKDKYYDGIDNLEYLGCFAMTELHHGKLICSYPGLSVIFVLQDAVLHYFMVEKYIYTCGVFKIFHHCLIDLFL